MPMINAYYSREEALNLLMKLINPLKEEASSLLTCGDITLKPDEITIRLIKTDAVGLIGDNLELEVFAHAFKERVDKQDEICLKLRDFVMNKVSSLGDVKVWLVLSELGHSWENME